MATIELPLASAMKGVTLSVVMTGARRARARIWAGAQLLKLGARVIGCSIDIREDPADLDVSHYRPLRGGPKRVMVGQRTRS